MADSSIEAAIVSLQNAVARLENAARGRAKQTTQGETLVQGEVISGSGGIFQVRLLDAGGNTTKVIGAQAQQNIEIAAGTTVSLRISALRKIPLIVSSGGAGGLGSPDCGVVAD